MKNFADPIEYTFYLPTEDREIKIIADTLEEAEAFLPRRLRSILRSKETDFFHYTNLDAELIACNGDTRF
tara:strand:+ start:464 stop:673 length:210 start_codon:yes stop_codon:yes gene_type:complete